MEMAFLGGGFDNTWYTYPLSQAQVYTDLTDKNHNNSVFLSKNGKKCTFFGYHELVERSAACPLLREMTTVYLTGALPYEMIYPPCVGWLWGVYLVLQNNNHNVKYIFVCEDRAFETR